MDGIADIFERVKSGWDRLTSTVFTDPMFCLLTITSYALFVFSITGVSGGWVTYKTRDIRNNSAQIKLGLFNAAVNNSWHQAPYSACIQQIDTSLSQESVQEHIMFCNGQLTSGVMMLVSLFLAFACAAGLTMILSSSLDQGKVLGIKPILIGLFSLSGLLNFISFCMGAGIMYRLIERDFPGSYYGVGFGASVVCWLLAAGCAIGTWYMIDVNGLMRTIHIFRLREPEVVPELVEWKKYNTL